MSTRAPRKAGGQVQATVKENMFIEAYFRHNCRGVDAALEVFDFGSKGGNPKNHRATARAIAAEYLSKPSVRRAIDQHLMKLEVSKEWVINQYKHLIENATDEKVRKDLLRDMANVHGLDITKDVTPTQLTQQQGVQVFLNVPQGQEEPVIDIPQPDGTQSV